MKVCFYCSYNLSPVGYQEVILDTETGVQSQSPAGVEVVKTLLTHGGANSAFGYDGAAYYFVLKNMRKTKPEVPRDIPGRDWYMNCALAASASELPALCAIAYYGYTAYQKFVARLAACLTPQEEEASYAVDENGWRKLMTEASARYQTFLETGNVNFADAPCGLELEQMGEAFLILRSRKIEGLYEFVLLEGELDYFLSSCGCKNPAQVRRWVKASGEPSGRARRVVIEPHGPEERSGIAPGLLLGGAALAAFTVYQIGKAVGKARRKRRKNP